MSFCVNWLSWPVLAIVIGTFLHWTVVETLLFKNHQLNTKSNSKSSYDGVVSAHPLIAKFLSFEKYSKTIEYANTNYSFNTSARLFARTIGLLVFAFCCWPHVIAWLQQLSVFAGSMLLTLLAATTAFSLAYTLAGIPFDLYDTFVIEEKFGFNTQTLKSWFADLVKSLFVSNITECVVIAGAYWVISAFPNISITDPKFIMCMLIVFLGVSFAYECLYINVIARVFNKFTALADKDLEKKITDMIADAGFSVSGIYVMDAGKRSKHGNAYFCGWGKCKRIVIYDVLLEKHTKEEIIAILCHEVGHLVHRDMLKHRLLGFLFTACAIIIGVNLVSDVSFYHVFGFSMVNVENITQWYLVGFSLVSLLIGSVSWLLDPLLSWLSRRDENAADAYAAEHADAEAMKSALIKLSADNLSNFNVHPWHEFWSYDHPSLKNRLRNLSK